MGDLAPLVRLNVTRSLLGRTNDSAVHIDHGNPVRILHTTATAGRSSGAGETSGTLISSREIIILLYNRYTLYVNRRGLKRARGAFKDRPFARQRRTADIAYAHTPYYIRIGASLIRSTASRAEWQCCCCCSELNGPEYYIRSQTYIYIYIYDISDLDYSLCIYIHNSDIGVFEGVEIDGINNFE